MHLHEAFRKTPGSCNFLPETSGDSKGGPEWDMTPRIFAWPPVCPHSFFLNFPFKFVWLTYVGLSNALCKRTGHFVNSACCVVICKRHKENRDNQYCYATINNLSFFWLIRYISVCMWRDNRTKDCDSSSKQTSLKKLSWQESLQESLSFEKFFVSSFWSYGKLFFSQYRLQTPIFKIPASAELAVKYRPSDNPRYMQ